MTLESAFRTLVLQLVPTVTFYWNKVDDNPVEPYVRAKTISNPPGYTHEGETASRAVIQMDIFDTQDADCATAAEAIRTALSGYRGSMGDYKVRILVRNVPSDWDEVSRLYRRILEMEVGYVR